MENNLNNCQFGISTPQKLVKKAVVRNYYKRQIRNMLITHLKERNDNCQINDKHIHYNFVIIIRHAYSESGFQINKQNLYKLLFFIYEKKIIYDVKEKKLIS